MPKLKRINDLSDKLEDLKLESSVMRGELEEKQNELSNRTSLALALHNNANNKMTLDDAKNKIAIERGYESFNHFIRQCNFRSKIKCCRSVESLMDEVVDLYSRYKWNEVCNVYEKEIQQILNDTGIEYKENKPKFE